MSDKNEIAKSEWDTENVISSTLQNLAEGITGIATSPRKDLILSISYIMQRMRGYQFLSTLQKEWNKYRERGKVKEDYQYSEQHKMCLLELLDFLENDSPDELRFKILKKVFLVAASEHTTDRESFLPQQFMKIARSLTDGEVIILTTVWRIAKNHEGEYEQHYGASQWVQNVTEASGMQYKELVETHEQGLMDKKLLSPRHMADKSGIDIRPHYRLTSLGYDFCQFIDEYEE